MQTQSQMESKLASATAKAARLEIYIKEDLPAAIEQRTKARTKRINDYRMIQHLYAVANEYAEIWGWVFDRKP